MNEESVISNINHFISIKKIKQSAIVKRSGINKDKLSRILNMKQAPTIPDLTSIASALGQSVIFFNDPFEVKNIMPVIDALPQPSFYMGQVTDERILQSNKYSQLAERLHYLKTMATITPTIPSDF